MKKSRFTESQIVAILKEGEAGVPVAQLTRKHGISAATYYHWKSKYAGAGADIEYAWQVKWRGNPRFEPGVQGFGTLGRSNDFAHETEHKIGPAFFGQVVLGARHKIKYDAAVLFGLNRDTPDTTIRFNLEYEI
jgi:hypothetical protein